MKDFQKPMECAPPKALTRNPHQPSPQGGCDCHFHLFGPHQRFALQPNRSYTPAESLWTEYAKLQQCLGLSRCVLVHPSVYGTDNSLLLHTLEMAQPEGSMRGVAVVDSGVTDETLQTMHGLGVRGVRFNLMHQGGPASSQVQALAERIHPLGWHTQVFASAQRLYALGEELQTLPTPLVIDHIGLPEPALGVDQQGFQWLLAQLQKGRCWVKLSGVYRLQGAKGPSYEVAQPFVQALLACAPERLVWGSDWPHPGVAAMPDDVALFELLEAWGCTSAQKQRILVENPAQLYAF